MGELIQAYADPASAFSQVDSLEHELSRIDDLACAAEVVIEQELGRDSPAGTLATLLAVIREHASAAKSKQQAALAAMRVQRAA